MVKLKDVYEKCPSCNGIEESNTIACDNENTDLVESWVKTHKNRFFFII